MYYIFIIKVVKKAADISVKQTTKDV